MSPLYRAPYRARSEEPQDHGWLAWVGGPSVINSGAINVSGTLYGTRVQVPTTISVTGLATYITAAGVTLTSAQSLLGLYTSAGAKIAQTADQSAVWTSTGFKKAALTSGPFVVVGGPNVFVYVAFLSVGTTPPTFRGLNGTAAYINADQTVGLGGTSVTQATQTTIPSTFAPTAVSALGQWAALY